MNRAGPFEGNNIARVSDILTLPDGRVVELGERTSGGSKNHTRFGTMPGGEEVVVKTQASYGRLPEEAAALHYAARYGLPVPRVVGAGNAPDGGFVLVLSREPGTRPIEPDGWHRMGRDLAALTGIPVHDCTLHRTSAHEFVTDHEKRLRAVESLLEEKLAVAVRAAIHHFAANDRLVLTHGDPGSGNYLRNGDAGIILDWETASVAPYGIDAGRGSFIALLDNGHTGIPDQLHAAFVRGYRDGLPRERSLDEETLSAATVIAALQFIHERHVHPLRPDRTPHMAIEVLEDYLRPGDAA